MPRELKIFIDGACEPKNPGGVPTYGFVIYADGKKLCEDSGLAAEPWTRQASNNVAEYTALIKALEKVLTLGLEDSEVEVRSDSRLLVHQVNGEYAVRAPRIRPLHEKVTHFLPRFRKVTVKWIPREENTEADTLTRRAYEAYTWSAPSGAKVTQPNAENAFIFCYKCGTQISRDSRFCKECGAKLA